ncbi:MAG: selenocysteine-specific translation elongation factor [Planctomycetota bacterium]|nr:MAG: selenocysteine-specific translation elongation factor [Planctomycetota bacterium]REK22042.1 MAG: selenocysteine-specific translation elongation factor [Planctomycetota bacterium]REK44450.1 MAG: selenocysteine-specific translation elongation factor [Planctomycetota bacterium]
MATDLILGTAGHIDHGKTALVRALTGVDTDRLPEEKKRGITIDLGFASLELGEFHLGIVDVPGHEKFVRNMLAGATAVDLVLLVVAADDSVKPQTREHLDILKMLDIKTGVIALTKCDVAEPEWLELVESEVRDLVAGSFLAEAPLVRTSAHTGEGIDNLKNRLTAAAQEAAARRRQNVADGPFRLAIDRVFAIEGHGTVVTGSVLEGTAKLGDTLSLEPGGLTARVRGLQNHDATVDEVHAGQRAAINLAGVHHDQLKRGCELATSGYLLPTRLLTVELELLQDSPRTLKNRKSIRVHIGTNERMATVVLPERDELQPGERSLAQLFLSGEVLATWGQPFVLRSESPIVTVGGGRVLAPHPQKLRRDAKEEWARVGDLASEDECRRAAAAIYFAGHQPWQARDLVRNAGVRDAEAVVRQLLDRGDVLEQLTLSPTRTLLVHQGYLDVLGTRIEAALRRLHEENPRQLVFEPSRLAARFAYLDEAFYRAVVERLAAQGRVELSPRGVALAGQGPQLTKNEKALLQQIIDDYRSAGQRPPTLKELKASVTKNQAAVTQLIELAEAQGHLVRLSPDLYLHVEAERQMRETLREPLAGGTGLTMSEIREILDTSRKYAVPLCEHFDRTGFTRRSGDLRILAES